MLLLHRPVFVCGARRGFTLVELLVVIAIIAIITALSVPNITSALRSYKLNSTGQIVINQLNLARQTALSQGHAVQVRFYQLPDYNLAATAAPTVYRGMECFVESDPVQGGTNPVTTTPVIKPVFFPTPIIISTSSAGGSSSVSPLVSGTSTTPITVYNNDPTTLLPFYGANYKYVVFRFKPDGSTDLPSTGNVNSISLVIETDKAVAGGLPANFQTIAIDPLNGTMQSFRP